MYPRLEINIDKLKTNTRVISDMCKTYNLSVAMVTKSYCAIPEVVEELVGEGIDYIADSRISNLKKLKHINLPKVLLRIPMISEVYEVVKYADISFNSELKTIKALDREAARRGKMHDIVVMVDLGDLREGYFKENELLYAVHEIMKMGNIRLVGLGTNLTCYGAVIPSKENLSKLANLAKFIEKRYDIKLDFISGGNSSSIHLLEKGEMPEQINNIRPGEAIILGRESAYGKNIEGTYQDVFKLVCEIVEIKDKPSIPIGEIGVDAFGKVPEYKDKGIRKRAIVAIGKQDVNIDSISPVEKGIDILGASSDHMILDVTGYDFEVGDKVEFLLEYGGLMACSTSEYVHKELVREVAMA